jgi:diacylglycerol kinase (ATP)
VAPVIVIINPAARSERARKLCAAIEELSERSVVYTTGEAGEAREMAEKAAREGYQTIVAAGGDGTINEIVNGIAGYDLTLGVLPIGTMNVFATELGLPSHDLRKAWAIIETGHVREVDLPCVNDHYFVQLAGIGFDAQVVQATTREFKKNFGPLSYVISAAHIASRKPPRLIIEADERVSEGSFVLVGNGRYYGGPFVIFKNAKIDDGMLDVLVFKNLGYIDIVRYLQAIIFGTHTELHDVEYFQASQLRIQSEQEVPVEVDGEVVGTVPARMSISRKLKVLTLKES